jgi:hypothetical protein
VDDDDDEDNNMCWSMFINTHLFCILHKVILATVIAIDIK